MPSAQSTKSSAPQQHSISSLLIGVLARVVERRGVDPTSLSAELSSGELHPLGQRRTRFSEFEVLFARAMELTGDPALGLRIPYEVSESHFGVFGHLLSHAPTLRASISVASRFHSLLIDDGWLFLTECGDTATIRLEFTRSELLEPSYSELVMSGFMRIVQEFGAAPSHVRAVYFEHAPPAHRPEYANVFGGIERFRQAFTGMAFWNELLDRPRLQHQAELYRLFEAQAELELESLPRPKTVAEKLRTYLAARPVGRIPDLPTAARRLDTSERTLRRQLAREGVTYNEVAQATLRQNAERLLRDPARTLQEVAHQLGFADPSSFSRAFKRWTGQTPGQYRSDKSLQ